MDVDKHTPKKEKEKEKKQQQQQPKDSTFCPLRIM
jgi:hypothetical protein